MPHSCQLTIDQSNRLAELRSVLETSSGEDKVKTHRQLLELEAEQCYECKSHPKTQEHFPFCCAECHEAWAAVNAPQVVTSTKSIEDCQARIQEILHQRKLKRFETQQSLLDG
jgi:endogenous inhibitor of DNA gyrase (YacG/DUF329 family)